jgi:ubiquinone/menaquinone biosynthesis C-methylase UbiE
VNESGSSYLLAGQPTELERIQLQSRVWEPAGRELMARLPGGSGRRALDIGCGAMGWLRILSEWVGPSGSVVGADIDDKMLASAKSFVDAERLRT